MKLKTTTMNIDDALKGLVSASQSLMLAVDDYGPQILEVLKNRTIMKGASSPEEGAEWILQSINPFVRDLVALAEECHNHLGYRGEFIKRQTKR